MSATTRGRGPDVAFPPPTLFALAFFAGWLVHRFVVPLWVNVGTAPGQVIEIAGWAIVVAGLGLVFWGIATFNRLRTAVYPNRDASTLVIEGPYRFTRNPMYTGMTVAYLGGCAVVGSLWPVVFLPVAMVALYQLVIKREERHLTEAFGDSYRDYQRRVGRWV